MMYTAIYPQKLSAEGFTGADFGNWSETSKDGYIQASIMMAGVIGAQTQPEISRCIDAWYFQTEDSKSKQNAVIRQTISTYPNYHPSGVILAIVQEACGAFE